MIFCDFNILSLFFLFLGVYFSNPLLCCPGRYCCVKTFHLLFTYSPLTEPSCLFRPSFTEVFLYGCFLLLNPLSCGPSESLDFVAPGVFVPHLNFCPLNPCSGRVHVKTISKMTQRKFIFDCRFLVVCKPFSKIVLSVLFVIINILYCCL